MLEKTVALAEKSPKALPEGKSSSKKIGAGGEKKEKTKIDIEVP